MPLHAALILLLALAAPLWAQAGPELLANPGFDVDADGDGLPDEWSTDPARILYREGVAFGGDWEIVSRPGAYVLATQGVALEPGETYTIMVEARGSGGAQAGALLLHGADRPHQEMPLIWRQPVEQEYHTFFKVFEAPNPVARIYLYNVAKTGEISYRRASLRKGTPDHPLVRDIEFGPMDEPETPPVITPHFPWAKPLAGGPITSLFVTRSFRSWREHIELEQRVDLDADLVDTYGTDAASPEGLRTQERLAAGSYDVYVVNGPLTEPFQKSFAAARAAGKGLVIVDGFGRTTGLVDPATLQPVGDDHYLKRDLPWSVLPAGALPEITVAEGNGGRVVRLAFDNSATRVWSIQPVLVDQSDWLQRTLHHWEYWHAFLGRTLAWAAGRDAGIDLSASSGADGITLAADGLPAGATLELTPRSGRQIRFDRPDLTFTPVIARPGQPVPWPDEFPGGAGIADVRVLNADGQVLYWAGLPVERPRAGQLADVAVEPAVAQPGGEVKVTARSTAAQHTRMEATLIDAYGRAYARATQEVPAEWSAILNLRLDRTLTAGNKLMLRLLDADGHELDSAWRTVLVPELNHRQAWDDFHVTAWSDGFTNPVVSHQYNVMIRELGLNGKFAGFVPLNVEDGLWPTESSGSRGYFPGAPRADRVRSAGTVSDPAFYERAAETRAERMAGKSDYGVVGYSIGDEITLSNRHQIDEVDWSEISLAAFRDWLRVRYPSLDALNGQWGTAFASWDAVMPMLSEEVRARDNFAPFVDFRTFMTDEWVKAIDAAADGIRTLAPDARAGHTNTFGSLPFNGVDYWKICTIPDFGWGQEYSEAIKATAHKAVFAFWRSFRPDDFPNLGWIGYAHRPDAVAYEPWWLALNGSRGVSYYAVNAADPGRNISWALIHPTQSYTPYSLAVKAALDDLVDGCGKALMATDAVEPEVALLWSHPSMLASWCESDWETPEPPDQPPFDAWGAWFRSAFNLRLLLEENGVAYEYLAPQQIAADAGVLDQYKAIYLPATVACDAGTLAALADWRDRGGLLVGDVNLLKYDEHGTPVTPSPLPELFGARPTGPVVWEASPVTGEHAFAGFGRQPLEPTGGAKVLARHVDGAPAVVVSEGGRGRSVLLNSLLPPDDPGAKALIDALHPAATFTRPVRVTLPGDPHAITAVSTTRRVRGPVELVGVIRDFRRIPAGETAPPTFRVDFGREAFVVDLRENRPLGRVDHVELPLAGGEAKLYALLPYAPTGLSIDAPLTAQPGADVPVTVAVEADGQPGAHVLHLELVEPEGRVPPGYAWNVVADGGRWTGALPLALNDAPGAWRLRVTDVTGGQTAEAAIAVGG